jgi:hypothetical protein
MHCPGCGVKVSANQNFCRSCGFGLEKISQLVAEQLTAKQEQAAIEIGKGSNDRLHLMEWLGIIGWYTFIGGGAVGVILLFYIIISKLIIDKGQIIPGIALLLVLAGALYCCRISTTWNLRKTRESARDSCQKHQPRREQPGSCQLRLAPR